MVAVANQNVAGGLDTDADRMAGYWSRELVLQMPQQGERSIVRVVVFEAVK